MPENTKEPGPAAGFFLILCSHAKPQFRTATASLPGSVLRSKKVSLPHGKTIGLVLLYPCDDGHVFYHRTDPDVRPGDGKPSPRMETYRSGPDVDCIRSHAAEKAEGDSEIHGRWCLNENAPINRKFYRLRRHLPRYYHGNEKEMPVIVYRPADVQRLRN